MEKGKVMEVNKLYPQYNIIQDRRKTNLPVNTERRSGVDRRSVDRVKLDTNLTRDIFELKSKVPSFAGKEPSTTPLIDALNKTKFGRSILTKMQEMNAPAATKPASAQGYKSNTSRTPDSASSTLLKAGLVLFGIGGAVSALAMGAVASVGAIGMGVYFGAKSMAKAVASHLRT